MPLFVTLPAYPTHVLPELLKITNNDTGLGDEKPYDANGNEILGWRRITYIPHAGGGIGRTVVDKLVNGSAGFDISIFGVGSSEALPLPGSQKVVTIASKAGLTYPPWVSQPKALAPPGTVSPANIQGISVFYDVYDCNGTHYWVQGEQEPKVPFPLDVLLFHELSHALHIVEGIYAEGDSFDDEEVRTIKDENKYRQSINPLLPPRHLVGLGGCGFTNPATKSSYCYIVTAAYGSQAPQVSEFRQLLNRLSGRSAFSDEFFAQTLTEYYRFSPQIANEMNASESLKHSILKLLVEPFMEFYALVEQYVKTGWQQVNFPDQVELDLRNHAERFANAGFSAGQVDLVYAQIDRLYTLLLDDVKRRAVSTTPSMHVMSTEVPAILDDVAMLIASNSTSTRFVEWAMIVPLRSYWSALGLLNGRETGGNQVGCYFVEQLEDWLAALPIPTAFEQLDAGRVKESFVQLSQSIFTIPRVRHKIGLRLIETHRDQVLYDLKALLQEVDYLQIEGHV